MSTQKIIITFLIVFFSLFFIINTTYYFSPNNQEKSGKISERKLGLSQISLSGSSYVFTPVESKHSFHANTSYQDIINPTDTAYILGKGYSKNILGNNITFGLQQGGLVLLDLYDISSNYIVNGESFRVKVKSPGKILIDTREKNIKIFSLSSVFEVALLDQSKEMTTLALHPKMFFSFNEARNKFLKNADLLRLETLTSIFYFNGEILDENKKINPNFLKKIGFSQDKGASDFLSQVFGILFSPENIAKYDPTEIKKYLIPVRDIGGLGYINEYFLLFLNDQKKIAYYKKKIVANLNKGFDPNQVLIKGEILTDIESFKTLNPEEFQKFLPVLYHYYDAYLKINSLDYIKNATILSEIIMNVNGNKKDVLKSYFYLNKIYALVNNQTFENADLQANFLEFLKLYFDEKHISLDASLLFNVKDVKMVGELDYMSLFIKNILLNDITFSDTSKLNNVFDIFKIYSSINENINIIKNNAKSETILVENNLIIEKILSEIRTNFFEKDLNQKGLLVLKKDENVSVGLVNNLNKTIKMFFHFYDLKKGNLSEKNQIYNQKYLHNNEVYSEYYNALSNYSEYAIKYDQVTKELFDTKTVLENKEDIVLSKENLLAYLSQFEGVDTGNFKFVIIGKNYYKITDITINGDIFSFNLFPKEGNKIKDMYRNGEKLTLTYELDSIKEILAKASEGADESELEKYDFSKFFMNTFFARDQKETKKFVDNEVIISESKNIQIFKRDKLLGDKGEFSILKGFLDLKYNNIEVNETSNGYNISLKDTVLRTSLPGDGTSIPVLGIITAKYVFNTKDHYFKDISIQFYNSEAFAEGDKIYLFDGKEFSINKNINIIDFKTEMNSIIQDYFNNN